ncbi:hypothetical protein CRJUMX02_1850003 [Escherichia coli]|nr:hypothetical protein CRJUMX02_1850003 [Escherichia coli]
MIVATMLTFKSAGSDRKSINFGLYCLPSDGSSNVPLMTPWKNRPSEQLHSWPNHYLE